MPRVFKKYNITFWSRSSVSTKFVSSICYYPQYYTLTCESDIKLTLLRFYYEQTFIIHFRNWKKLFVVSKCERNKPFFDGIIMQMSCLLSSWNTIVSFWSEMKQTAIYVSKKDNSLKYPLSPNISQKYPLPYKWYIYDTQ